MNMPSEFFEKGVQSLFRIVIVLALLVLLLVNVNADHGCICFYGGPCEEAEDGGWARWRQCTGACYAYSGWAPDADCRHEAYRNLLLKKYS